MSPRGLTTGSKNNELDTAIKSWYDKVDSRLRGNDIE
ncbi:palindromic element RPE4 domain-containing protein [Rickettsia asembonensis]|nr:palindromic element RPE4 domain-containing protein [Rickettsia asembonensis]